MANDKNKAAAKNPAANLDVDAIIKSMGFTDEDFQLVGGLSTIIPAEVQFEQQTTVVGVIVALLQMPPRKSLNDKEKKEEWQALMIKLAAPTLGMQGEDVVSVEAGKFALIPVNGAIRNNPDVLNAAADPEYAYAGIFRVTGQISTGKPSEMWNYEIKMALKKPIARTGDLALYGRSFGTNVTALVAGKKGEQLGAGNLFQKSGDAAAATNSTPATA